MCRKYTVRNAKEDGTYSYHCALKGQPDEALLATTYQPFVVRHYITTAHADGTRFLFSALSPAPGHDNVVPFGRTQLHLPRQGLMSGGYTLTRIHSESEIRRQLSYVRNRWNDVRGQVTSTRQTVRSAPGSWRSQDLSQRVACNCATYHDVFQYDPTDRNGTHIPIWPAYYVSTPLRDTASRCAVLRPHMPSMYFP